MCFDAEVFSDKVQAEDGYCLTGKAKDYGEKQRQRFGAVEFDSGCDSACPGFPFDCDDEGVFEKYRAKFSYFVHNCQNYQSQYDENAEAEE